MAEYIEEKIGKDEYAPDAVIGEIRNKELTFDVDICTETLYNYIDNGIFLNISNKDLPVKKDGKKRKYQHVRKVALNNRKGRSIDEQAESVQELIKDTRRRTAWLGRAKRAYWRWPSDRTARS